MTYGSNNCNNFPENQLTKCCAFYDLRCPRMIYPARGGSGLKSDEGELSEVRGSAPSRGSV